MQKLVPVFFFFTETMRLFDQQPLLGGGFHYHNKKMDLRLRWLSDKRVKIFLPWEIPSKRIRETIIAENPVNIYNNGPSNIYARMWLV